MDKNVGSTDKIIRIIVGIALLAFGLIAVGSTGFGILLMLVGVVLIATGALNFCPLFKLIGFNSLESGS